jgi:hypothetical protein
MKKKAWVSLFLTVVLLLTAAVPAFAAAQSERVQTEAKTVAVASGKDDAGCGNIVTLFRDCFARLKAMLARIFPFLKDTSVQTFPTVWDYDAGTVLQTGALHFDRLETNQAISVDANGRNVLIEISSVQNVVRGENSFHYIAAAIGQSG